MPLVTSYNLHKRYGPQVVLDGAGLTVRRGEKVGLIGPNGCGKTTLLRIMAGQIEPDAGRAGVRRGVRVAYLPQVAAVPRERRQPTGRGPDAAGERTVTEVAREAFAPLVDLQRQADALLERVAGAEDDADRLSLLRRHEELLERFRRAGGYEMDRRLDQVLDGLGLVGPLRQAPVRTLSGGEASRLAIARLLLAAPDVMFLDEPTNHLDIQATEWLEGFLADYDGAAVIVSHDRYLLDRTVTRMVEMRGGRTYEYRGNYTAYEAQRGREVETQRRAYHKQQEHIEHELDYIRRYHAGQRAREARGRARKLERLERVDRPLDDPKAPILNFVPDVRGGEIVCECRDVTKAFGSRTLFSDLTFSLTRRDRLAVLGRNGSGKTTLLRMMTGQTQPTAGRFHMGHNITIGYADQEQADLDESKRVIDEVWQVRPALTEGQMRSFLARFLFTGEAVFDPVGTLSGGERARVALAKVMLAGPNLLLLDEPTNHLDIPAREALEEALLEYGGTMVVVSHDRYFLNRIARKILHIADGRARLYLGDYDFFHDQRQKERAAEAEPAPARGAKSAGGSPARKRRKRDRKRHPIYASSFEELERQVTATEREVGDLAGRLGDVATYRDPDLARRVQADYDRAAAQLDALIAEWETRVEEMD